MDIKELEKKWEEIVKAAFDAFIKDNIGYKGDSDQPTCYGTGDDHRFCITCFYRQKC